jgi:chromosomal replication initiator protein
LIQTQRMFKGDQMSRDDAQLRASRILSIQEAVAQMFGVAVEELSKEGGARMVSMPRQIAIYLSREMTGSSAAEIGRYFGGKDPSTIRYSIIRIHELRRTDTALDNALSRLEAALTAREV